MSATTTGPTKFSVHDAPVLSSGNVQRLLGIAPALWAHVKVYAEGGENGVHAHPLEDHLFFVLGGEATFEGPDGEIAVVGPYEGMLIPRGTAYAFRSSGSRNLMLLRVGSPADTSVADADRTEAYPGQGIPVGIAVRVGVDGADAPGLAPQNKGGAVPGVPIPGQVQGAPAWR